MKLIPDRRPLTNRELDLAKSVFDTTIPYDQVTIANDLGIGDRPWTESSYLVGYVIHFGTLGYLDASSSAYMPRFGIIRNVFIHEMTHVWQGSHSSFHEGYMIRSVGSQAWGWVTNKDAYEYAAGLNWDDYNVEQQAHIVEDWFKKGMNTTDSRYQYIQDPIRIRPYWIPG